MEFKIGICGNDGLAIKQMEEVLFDYRKDNEAYLSVKSFTKMQELIFFLKQEKDAFDLIVLDMGLEKPDIVLNEKLLKLAPCSEIAFCTNRRNDAAEEYGVNHCYYIRKDSFREKLPLLITWLKQGKEEGINKIVISTRGSKELIPKSAIQYLERDRKITFVHTDTEAYRTSEKLQDILGRLDNGHFIRCHNSFVVNFRNVKSYSRQQFELDDGIKIPISRTYIEPVKEAFMEWVQNWL